jgi:hypothetical protein
MHVLKRQAQKEKKEKNLKQADYIGEMVSNFVFIQKKITAGNLPGDDLKKKMKRDRVIMKIVAFEQRKNRLQHLYR